MRTRKPLSAAGALTVLLAAAPAFAATFTQTAVPDFSGGVFSGSAVVMGDAETPPTGPQAGGVGIMPTLGASIVSDDFNYTTRTAASANWLFLTPNIEGIEDLATFPDEFLFSGDTSTTGGSAPSSGVFRLRASKPHDFYLNSDSDQRRQPILVINKTGITGDFIAETKLSFPEARKNGENRHTGIIVTHPTGFLSNQAENVTFDTNSTYVAFGPSKLDTLNTLARTYTSGSVGVNVQTTSFPGQDWYVRLVKRDTYYFFYARQGDAGPWIFQTWFSAPELAATEDAPVVVGLFAKSWAATSENNPQYENIDFDYLKVNRVGAVTGAYSNVLDAGSAVDWQTFGFNTHSMQGLKYQLRSGNAASGGTLTDAGAFAGPDGTANTWFEDDAAQVVPDAKGKQFLEYKFNLDGTPVNLPAYLDAVSAVAEPQGVSAAYASTKAEFGADAGGLAVQPGDGDLSLARTQVASASDDFSNTNSDIGFYPSPGASGWSFYGGASFLGVTGDYSISERPGWFRMKVGAPQTLETNTKDGGVMLLRDIPAGTTDFEIETVVDAEVSQNRMAGLVIFQDFSNFIGLSVAHRNVATFGVGIIENSLLSNTSLNLSELNYGSNLMQLRITKKGQIYTFSVRDVASPSPSWRVVGVRNAAATNENFAPIQVGFLARNYSSGDGGNPDRSDFNYDFDYFRFSTVSDTGTKDIAFNLPAGSRPDILRTLGDGLGATNARFQVSTGGGFVGPDGTAGTYFSPNEPKLPAAISSPAAVRVTLDGTTSSGLPYLHALGVQYATGNTTVQRDTNAADFNAALLKDNVDTSTTPGVAANANAFSSGDWAKDDLNFGSEDLTSTAWAWDTSHLNPNQDPPTSYAVTANPGHVRLIIGPREDIGTGARYHPFFHRKDALTGDWEIEARIDTPEGRDTGRITGIGVYQDQSNMILLGILNTGEMAQRSYSGGGIIRHTSATGAFPDASYYLRIQKAGQTFTSWAKPVITGAPGEADDPSGWVQVAEREYPGITNPQVGFMAHSVNAGVPQWPVDYDYFRIRTLSTEGVLQSRILDMGTAGNTPVLTAQGTNLAGIQLQFRAADTQAALTSLPFVGPDGTANTSYAGNYVGVLNGLTKRYVQYRAVIPVGASLNDVVLIAAPGVGPSPDVLTALKIAGGLQAASGADKTRLDVVTSGTSAGRVDLADAVKLLRDSNGL